MVLRNDGQEELSPPIWCSSRGMQSTKACVNTPEGATAWFGPNPPQKHIIQGDQTDTLKTFLKGEPQILGVAQILIGLMKVCLFAIVLRVGSCVYRCWEKDDVKPGGVRRVRVPSQDAQSLGKNNDITSVDLEVLHSLEGIRDCNISPLPAGSQHHYLSFCVWVQDDLLCHTGGGYPANQ
ncbi:uncharacterized protein LOC105241294 isoform X14 [Ailuropoda melanoleuca]|uniref:uncharacterized protein LOC105241294 isoform X14 n=1 Tax=Ailuropoda melanoleuca TaxID=9646 RepID=UPI0014943B33|nr:uncharacterized protein LOC105241294 isoform X14 [Ailuropoda melanoleuca]